MEWDRHYFPFALTNPRASVSDVLRMAPWRLGRRTRWFQAVVSVGHVNFVSAGGGVMRPRWVCGVRNDRGAALSVTCVSYHVAHGKVTTRVSPNEAHTVYCSVRNHIHSHAKPAPLRANGCCYYTHSTLHMAEPPHCAIGWCCYTHLETPNPAPHWLKEAQHAPPPPDPNPSPVAVPPPKGPPLLTGPPPPMLMP